MAVIGSWGDIVFAVSRREIKTFDGLQWESTANYASHDRHLKDPLLEFTGNANDTMSFNMFFSVYLGVNPIKEIAKLLTAQRNAEVHALIIGPKGYGKNKWVITKASTDLQRFNNHGELLVAKVSVSMTAYAAR